MRFVKFLFLISIILSNLEATIKMGIITSSHYVGDREIAWRIKIAGEKLGWKVFIDEEEGRRLKYHELDWVICMLPDNNISDLPCPNYLMVFHPFNYLDEKRNLKPFYTKYDGYLLTINDRENLKEGLKQIGKEFHHVRFYPTIYRLPFQKPTVKDLVVMIPVWGNRLADPKFGNLYHLLSLSGFVKFYGKSLSPDIDPKTYMGSIPFDGSSVINVLKQHGMVFVFHSEAHNKDAIPSGRIFEAAASSSVIIADQNPFVKKHFGDSVFYVDTRESAENIFKQIETHVMTILQNPEMAQNMAMKAHQTYIGNFTMENQLLQLKAMHRKVMRNWKPK